MALLDPESMLSQLRFGLTEEERRSIDLFRDLPQADRDEALLLIIWYFIKRYPATAGDEAVAMKFN